MAPVLQPSQRIDDTYELVVRVAAGGGQVWQARGPSGTPVAVKFLRSAHDPRLDRLLAREIAHTARLSHPHIVDILARGTFGEHRYAVLEWMQGGTLSQQLPRLSLPDIVQALQAVLAALAHAHMPSPAASRREARQHHVRHGAARLAPCRLRHRPPPGPQRSSGRRHAPVHGARAAARPWPRSRHGSVRPRHHRLGAPPRGAPYRGSIVELFRQHRSGTARQWAPLVPGADALRPWVEQLLTIAPEERPRSAAAASRELDAGAGADAVARALEDGTRELPALWICDPAPAPADLEQLLASSARALAVVADGPRPTVPHRRVPVPPVSDATVRGILIGLLSFHEESIDEAVPALAGSLGTLMTLLDHLQHEGHLVQSGFRTHISRNITWPRSWTRGGLATFEALRQEAASREEREHSLAQLDLLAASPPRFTWSDMVAISAERGLPPPDTWLARGIEERLLWRDGERIWWCDPLLAQRLDRQAPSELLAAWARRQAQAGETLAAAERMERAEDVTSAVALLSERITEDGRLGRAWSIPPHENALARLVDRGATVEPALEARCRIADVLRRFTSGELDLERSEQRLEALLASVQHASPIDSALARAQACLLAFRSLEDARDLVVAASEQPWTDPSAFVDHVGFLASIEVASGRDPMPALRRARDELPIHLTGPRAWLEIRIAQALIANGRPGEALRLLQPLLAAPGTNWAPTVANTVGEALRLSGAAAQSLPHYQRSIDHYLALGLSAWSSSAVNLACAVGMAGHPATALHMLTALGRRGTVVGHAVLDTCRVAHVAANYAVCKQWPSTRESLDAYDALAGKHEAVDQEQSVALQIVRRELLAHQGPGDLLQRVHLALEAMPHRVPDTWSPR